MSAVDVMGVWGVVDAMTGTVAAAGLPAEGTFATEATQSRYELMFFLAAGAMTLLVAGFFVVVLVKFGGDGSEVDGEAGAVGDGDSPDGDGDAAD